ncbi:MAG: NTP transferase domain-containing protein [Polyangiaceae bacterium]|jgi:CTP:molybdopterin cytidylyltransferase MocA|nr:NTP transferase domain-containing protein [Polyangiaceae bacterium]MBK8942594.1 NTP transferase domain-containing protein [Polyangiaceae bacterium]
MSEPTVSPSVSYVAIVTAAGLGERMGGPKALLAVRWGDNTGELPLAIAHARAHLEGGAERVIVVTKASTARMLSRFSQRGLDIIVSTAPHALGPSGSIRQALSLLPRVLDQWLMIEPVDMPPSSAAIRRELLGGALREPPPDAVRPVHNGRRGHPVLVRRGCLDAMLVPEPPTLREVLKGLGPYRTEGGGVLDVDVVDVRAITELDVPEDVTRFYGHAARFFTEEEPTQG